MKRKAIGLIVLNIISALSVGVLGSYVVVQLVHDILKGDDFLMAVAIAVTITIAVVSLVIVSVLSFTTVRLLKGAYYKRLQIFAAVLFILLVSSADAVLHGHFSELAVGYRIALIYINIVAVCEMIGSVFIALIWEKQFS